METNLNFLKTYANPSVAQNKPFILERSNRILDNPFADPYYKYRTALFLLDMGEADKAYEVTRKLYLRDKKNCDFIRALAYFEALRKNSSAAISMRIELSKSDPWNAENYFQLMLLYKDTGDIDNANLVKRKIISIAPNSDIAKKTIEIFG